MLLVIVCACVVAVGFFFAARQHFTSMDYGLKNSKLRDQLQNLETEKRRLLLSREVASSPMAIRKASRGIGAGENSEATAVAASTRTIEKNVVTVTKASSTEAIASKETMPMVVRTSMSTPVQSKPAPPRSTGEIRSRVVDVSKEKNKNEVAALLKLR
jgi:hypothetical protein